MVDRTEATKGKRLPSEPASGTPVEKASRAIAHSAVVAGRAVGKTGARIAQPLVQTVKHEETQTLAKMAVAAIAPQLINAAVRLALRKPFLTAVGVLVLITALGSQQEES